MKRKTFIFLTCIMVILCIGLSLSLENILEDISYYVLCLPIYMLADGLRTLSLSSSLGNGIALLLYGLVSISPLVILYNLYKTKKHSKEDIFLILLSISLFIGIYFTINPSYSTIPMLISGIIYSIIISYFVLKILRMMKTANDQTILKYLHIGFIIILVYLLFTTFYTMFVEYQLNMLQLKQNYDISIFIKQFIDSLPYFMCSIIIYHILNFVNLYQKDPYSENALNKIIQIRDFSIQSLKVIVLSGLVNCILQFLLVKYMNHVSIQIELPIVPIVGILGITFISKMFTQTISLKRDNEMFI